ncbi:MAG: hypothetical protein GYB64_00535 [Chloroflexi bacterium]|nr:hypothetical protein [Chloroflexota bacterium]
MYKRLLILLGVVLALVACGSPSVEDLARERMEADGHASASIMDIVEGEPSTLGVDELYCVATDATSSDGSLPYLLLIYSQGGQWTVEQLEEGFYEWTLYGCPL